MNNYERYEKYVELQCPNCKNKNSNLCEIRITSLDGVIKTRCVYYEKEKNQIKKPFSYFITAKKHKPLMRF